MISSEWSIMTEPRKHQTLSLYKYCTIPRTLASRYSNL